MSRSRRRIKRRLLAAALWLAGSVLIAAEQHGQVTYQGLPVPGATVTLSQGSTVNTAVTDERGLYSFAQLAEGAWEMDIAMAGFESVKEGVTVGATAVPLKSELKMLPLERISATASAALVQPAKTTAPEEKQPEQLPKVTKDEHLTRAQSVRRRGF